MEYQRGQRYTCVSLHLLCGLVVSEVRDVTPGDVAKQLLGRLSTPDRIELRLWGQVTNGEEGECEETRGEEPRQFSRKSRSPVQHVISNVHQVEGMMHTSRVQ